MDAVVRAEAQAEAHGRRGDTRARIQRVALELFAEQGYEGTSLREIAERLSVTKAALYYHFKSKEDIVRSFTEDHFTRLDALITWATDQPPGPVTGHEILERYVSIMTDGSDVFRFMEQNQAVLNNHGTGKHRFEQFRPRLETLVRLIIGPGATPRAQVRATTAFFATSVSFMYFHGKGEIGPQELRELVLEAADDLIRDVTAA
ncbi:MAG TPA: helix-turn-helix domain-containing protein [Trebonia sp.]|jgi:AcrR family transcriptional regulator|nr:helix-turn-helix domain-containing protein [Trebonia sp.]